MADPRGARRPLPRLDADRLLPRAWPALDGARRVRQARHLAPVPDVRLVLRRPARGDVPVRARPHAADARRAVPGRGAARARPQGREVLPRRRLLPRARKPAHGAEEPALGLRVPRAHGLRGPPRARPLEHARDDRRRRHAAGHRTLLAGAAARGRPAACQRGPRPVRVLVHGRRPRGLLRLADRQRDRDGPADRARLELSRGQGAHGQLVQGADRDGRRGDGPRLLVLRDQRLRDHLPVAPRPRAEAAVAPVEVLRDGRRGPDGRHRPGRDPGAAGERELALQGGPCRRVDRPDQPRAHQPRHRPDDARRRRVLRADPHRGRGGALASAAEHRLLRAPRRLARLLLLDPLPRASTRAGSSSTTASRRSRPRRPRRSTRS